MNAYQKSNIKRTLASGWFTFSLALLITSPVIVWAFDRQDPVTVHEFGIVPDEVFAGQKVVRRIAVTRKRSCITDVDIVIIDGAKIRWIIDEPEVTSPGPVGVRDEYNAPMIIPPNAAPGVAEMRTIIRRKCNPLHAIWPLVTTYPTLHFKIMPKE